MSEAGERVLSYETFNVRTDVFHHDSGAYRWRETTGRMGIAPAVFAPEEALAAFEDAGTPRIGFAVARPVADGIEYRVPSPLSVGWRLLGAKIRPGDAVGLAAALGGALRGLHRKPVPPGYAEVPRRLRELSDWAWSGLGTRDASFLHTAVAERLGTARWKIVLDWCAELVGRRACLCHGAVTLGHLVPDEELSRGWLLTGPDIGASGPEVDVGKFLAEIPAYTEITGMMERGALDLGEIARAFLDGYGDGVDRDRTGRAATVMYLSGLRHVAAHLGWRELINARIDRLADMIDGAGRSLVAAGEPLC
ncbi:hypothetical protein [Amycolatopsis sp. CA-230715]|uniref:hypothetical protein n=1 Tax=Amycolatopsis sp. CA-230715 TaxID=2745196 RepID=UPI001C0169E6|nr:hypothetical protein [Amycolatopsis sp. CA-230715]QWF82525.1 hypothetical protein HUW46_05963 [Amycolatopsis sp. CA-230715]